MSKGVAPGILIMSMVAFSIVGDIANLPAFIVLAGVCAWCAVFFIFRDLKVSQRWQAGVLTTTGLCLILLSQGRTDVDYWFAAIGNNAALLTMLASVGFLRLITLAGKQDQHLSLPVGFGAYVKTLLGVSLFGSVINLSAPVLFADRLHEQKVLGRLASQSIVRIFTATSTWSPFFGGMAAVLTYVPDMSIGFAMAACFPFAVVSFLVVVLEAKFVYTKQVTVFKGYPVNFFNLWIPATLAVLILLLSRIAPHWSVLTWISVAALSLTTVVLLSRSGVRTTGKTLIDFVSEGLPRMANELQLFLAAGVLAAGLAAVSVAFDVPLLTRFGAAEAALLLGVLVMLAVVGLHPVVTIAGATPLIMTLQPAPDLLAVCYLLAWGLGTCASPLSGTQLVFQGRYDIPSWKGAVWNWPYVALMYFVAVAVLAIVARTLA